MNDENRGKSPSIQEKLKNIVTSPSTAKNYQNSNDEKVEEFKQIIRSNTVSVSNKNLISPKKQQSSPTKQENMQQISKYSRYKKQDWVKVEFEGEIKRFCRPPKDDYLAFRRQVKHRFKKLQSLQPSEYDRIKFYLLAEDEQISLNQNSPNDKPITEDQYLDLLKPREYKNQNINKVLKFQVKLSNDESVSQFYQATNMKELLNGQLISSNMVELESYQKPKFKQNLFIRSRKQSFFDQVDEDIQFQQQQQTLNHQQREDDIKCNEDNDHKLNTSELIYDIDRVILDNININNYLEAGDIQVEVPLNGGQNINNSGDNEQQIIFDKEEVKLINEIDNKDFDQEKQEIDDNYDVSNIMNKLDDDANSDKQEVVVKQQVDQEDEEDKKESIENSSDYDDNHGDKNQHNISEQNAFGLNFKRLVSRKNSMDHLDDNQDQHLQQNQFDQNIQDVMRDMDEVLLDKVIDDAKSNINANSQEQIKSHKNHNHNANDDDYQVDAIKSLQLELIKHQEQQLKDYYNKHNNIFLPNEGQQFPDIPLNQSSLNYLKFDDANLKDYRQSLLASDLSLSQSSLIGQSQLLNSSGINSHQQQISLNPIYILRELKPYEMEQSDQDPSALQQKKQLLSSSNFLKKIFNNFTGNKHQNVDPIELKLRKCNIRGGTKDCYVKCMPNQQVSLKWQFINDTSEDWPSVYYVRSHYQIQAKLSTKNLESPVKAGQCMELTMRIYIPGNIMLNKIILQLRFEDFKKQPFGEYFNGIIDIQDPDSLQLNQINQSEEDDDAILYQLAYDLQEQGFGEFNRCYKVIQACKKDTKEAEQILSKLMLKEARIREE
eukprot:403345466